MEKVSVSKGILIGIGVVAAASLLGFVFLLGRVTGSARNAPEVAVVSSPVRDVRQTDRPPLPTPSWSNASGDPAPVATPWPSLSRDNLAAPQFPQPTADATVKEPPSAGGDPLRPVVKTYLDAVDRIQPGKLGGDPESVARNMAAALVKGDTSGLDKIIKETDAAKGALAAIAPPPPCAAHYRESVGSLDDALEMLRSLKSAMESSEPATQLALVASRAQALQSRAEAVQKEEQALRQRFALTR